MNDIDSGGRMIRTVISLDAEDKAWLDRAARANRTRMTELVRRAIRQFRARNEGDPAQIGRLLSETAGTWKHGDGLAYQKRLRRDWNRRK
jgi:predicted transcriptional regulator